jgi:hypothetical protein
MRDEERMMAKRVSSRRARTAVLSALLAFVVLQVGMAFVIERWRPDWSDPEYGYRATRLRKLHASAGQRPLVLFLGSSRVGSGFVTDEMPPPETQGPDSPTTFNLSLAGGGPFFELLCLQRQVATGIHPQWVVIEILPPLLYTDGANIQAKGAILMHRLRWSDLKAFERHTPALAWHRYQQWLEWNALPWYSNRFRLMGRYAPSWMSEQQSHEMRFWRQVLTGAGWNPIPLDVVNPIAYQNGVKVAQEMYRPACQFTQVNPTTDQVLRDLLDLCRRENIRVAGLVRMPEGKDFRDLYAPQTEALITSYLTKLAEDYGTHYVDASCWMPEGSFVDGHHLIAPAARAFSRRFWVEIVQPQMEGRSIRTQTSPLTAARGQ